MKRFFGKTIVALMLFSLVACEESRVFGVVKPDEEDPGQDAGEYATETVYFPKESMDLVIDRNTEGVVRLSASTPREWIPEVGRVFALPRDEAYPLGYFGKVAEIDEGEDGYALRLEEVSIADLFPDTTLVIDVELSSDKLIPLDGDGRSLAQTRAEGVDISGDLTYRVGNAVELSGYFAFEGVRYKSELNTRKGEIYVCTMDVYSDCSFAMDAKLKLEPKELSVFLDDFRYGYVLNDYFGVGIRFDVGAYIHPSFEVDLGLGMEYHANIRAGFDYRDGQVNERCVTENESADMDLTGSARMGGSLFAGVYLKAYPFVAGFGDELNSKDNLYVTAKTGIVGTGAFDLSVSDLSRFENRMEVALALDLDFFAHFPTKGLAGADFTLNGHKRFEKPLFTYAIWPDFHVSQVDTDGTSVRYYIAVDQLEWLVDFPCYVEVREKESGQLIKRTELGAGLAQGGYLMYELYGLDADKDYLFIPMIRWGEKYIQVGHAYESGNFDPSDIPGIWG